MILNKLLFEGSDVEITIGSSKPKSPWFILGRVQVLSLPLTAVKVAGMSVAKVGGSGTTMLTLVTYSELYALEQSFRTILIFSDVELTNEASDVVPS